MHKLFVLPEDIHDNAVTVTGNDERILLVAIYDNLGKGASGAAIECMNVVLGADKSSNLDIYK